MIDEDLLRADRLRVIDHYERVAPLLAANFVHIPVTSVYLPEGFDGPETRIAQLHKGVPTHIPTISVTTRSGTHPYLALTANSLLWRVHAYAIAFESWCPTAGDPLALRFARIAIEPSITAPRTLLRDAIESVSAVLARSSLGAAIVLDGPGAFLWIPFDDAPPYLPVRAWLHTIIDAAFAEAPALFETTPADPPGRIRLSVRTNAPGLGSSLPYTLRCLPDLPMVTPIRHDELDLIVAADFTPESVPARLAATGDIFAAEVKRIGSQRFESLPKPSKRVIESLGPVYEYMPRAEVIQVAYKILSDGKPRPAEDIIAEATQLGIWPKDKDRKYLYVQLKMYIEKTLARGRQPLMLQDPDRKFRLNHAPDDNPDPKPSYAWKVPQDLIDRLHTTADGDDPAAFEIAVCDAFVPLGFKTTHVGEVRNPDGYADAMLGPLGYRFMIECKTSWRPMQRPDIFEASKFRDQFGAQYCIIIAQAFGDDRVIADECKNHGVSAWTIEDLSTLLQIGATPLEIRPMLEPGIAEDARAELLWSRNHGASKRAAVVCDAILEAGWNAQAAAADFHAPSDAPLLTEDAGMLLVDEYLHSHGSHIPCTREEVRQAFSYLTNPRVGMAAWVDETRAAIVVLHAPDAEATVTPDAPAASKPHAPDPPISPAAANGAP